MSTNIVRIDSMPARFSLGAARVDLGRREVDGPHGLLQLTELETRLLAYLAQRPGIAVDRRALLRDVWVYAPRVRSRAPHFAVLRLRKKIEVDPQDPVHLKTVYGVGFRLDGVVAINPEPSDRITLIVPPSALVPIGDAVVVILGLDDVPPAVRAAMRREAG